MTFAAMLLMSVSAFAQSASISKCDVNGDGIVNVADITAIIGTIKSLQRTFYLGTIEPTAENYKSLSTTRTSMEDALGTTVSVAAGQTVYLLCSTSWIDKWSNVFLENNSGEAFDFSDDIDVITIPGYSIYKTQALNETSTMTLKIKHQNNYYIGLTNASKTEWSLSELNSYSATAPESFTIPATTSDNPLAIIIYPEEWGDATHSITKISGIEGHAWLSYPIPLTLPSDYNAAYLVAESTSFVVTMKQWLP